MWFTALMLGLAGSLHCLGMCSPLAMAVTNMNSPFFMNRVLYNGGRLFSYGLLGAFVTAFGSLFQFSGYQNLLSLTLGCVLIVFAVLGITNIRIPWVSRYLGRGTGLLKQMFAKFLNKKTPVSITIMGMLNGLLPCGLTYLALAYCITLPAISQGFLFMIVFGSGTLPVMLGLTSVLQALINRFKINFSRVTTVMMIVLGTLLIARGWHVDQPDTIVATSEQGIVICK